MTNTMRGIRKLAKKQIQRQKKSSNNTKRKSKNMAFNPKTKSQKSAKPQNDPLHQTLKKAGWSLVPYRFNKNQKTG